MLPSPPANIKCEVHDFLINFGASELVADFITNPEWLHVGSAALLTLAILAAAYLIRIDIDPIIFGKRRPFNSLIEMLIFYPVVIGVIWWTYASKWWPEFEGGEGPPDGLYYNKFTLGVGLLLVLVIGRAVVHFIKTESDRWDYFDNLPFYLMVLFQFFVPLATYNALERNMLMPKEELGFIFTCVFIFYFIARYFVRRPVNLPKNPVSIWMWLFIAYILITLLFFPYRLAAIKNIIQWIAFAACFLIGLAYIPDKRRRDVVLLIAIIATLASTLWGFWKYFDIPLNVFSLEKGVYPEEDALLAGLPYFYKTPSAGRYFLLAGFFANPNYYGEYLALTLFVGLGMLLSTNSKNLRIFLSVALAINSFEMVALYNRAGWLGIFTGAAFVLFGLAWARLPVFRRVTKFGLIGGITALVLILALTGVVFNARETDDTPLSDTPWERLKSMTDFSGDETLRNRLTMWRAAQMMLTDESGFPWRLMLGGGFGFYDVEYLPYQTKVLETYDFNEWFHNVIPTFRAHNDHLQMLVEAGLVGTLLYAMFFVMVFVYGFRFIKEENNPALRFYALGVLGATASILATAFFSFPLHKIQHGGFIFLAIGCMIADIVARKRAIALDPALALPETEKEETPAPAKKKKRKKIESKPVSNLDTSDSTGLQSQFYNQIRGRVKWEIASPLIIIALLLCIWGVYTQIINFKSQYLVVKGIAALRNITNDTPPGRREYIGRVAADFFWDAYQLDPTNGRAEFFHGFALTKIEKYAEVVSGTEHLEEGQVLYPQSDTFYALGLGYEVRRRLADELARNKMAEAADHQLTLDAGSLSPEAQADLQTVIDKLKLEAEALAADALLSQDRAIDAYRTAAIYYPVKVEYYKELIKLLEEKREYPDIEFWAERALVVDDWLLQKPPIRWQLYLSRAKAERAQAAQFLINGDDVDGAIAKNLETETTLRTALFDEALPRATGYYYLWYELGQVYEALGDIYVNQGEIETALDYYSQSRDMYVETFSRKDRRLQNQPPFDYIYYLLGRIYEKLGDGERALRYYRQTLTDTYYSNNTDVYQKARDGIFNITGEWEGEPPGGEVVPDHIQ